MERDFLVLECPRCGGRLRSSDDPNVFRCRHCDFDVMHRDQRPVVHVEARVREVVDDVELYRAQLKLIKTKLQELRSNKDTGCGCITVLLVSAFVWVLLSGFSISSVLIFFAIALGGGGVHGALLNAKTPEERALEEQIQALEKVIARKEGW